MLVCDVVSSKNNALCDRLAQIISISLVEMAISTNDMPPIWASLFRLLTKVNGIVIHDNSKICYINCACPTLWAHL